MHELIQTVTKNQPWLFGSTVTSGSLISAPNSEPLSSEQLTTLSTSLLVELANLLPILSTRIGDETHLINLRGRPAETFTHRSTAVPQKQEELLFIEGEISLPPEEGEENEDEPPLPFSLAINSRFEKIDRHEIIHRALFAPTGAIVHWGDSLSASTLTKAPLLRITTLRLGFEHFVPSFFGSMLGSIPTIRSRFYLELEEDRFSISIVSDDKADKHFTAEKIIGQLKISLLNQVRLVADRKSLP